LLVVRAGGAEITLEVIDDLRGHARPVDRIDRADAVSRLERGVVRHRLDDVLGVVEHAGHGDVVDVVVLQRIHLRPLERAHLAMRRQHEHAHPVLAAHRILGCRTGVARRRTENVDLLATKRQHVLEQVAEQLHRHVLEREGRAIGQFEQRQASGAQPMHRGDLARVVAGPDKPVGLGGIGALADRLQVRRRDVGDEFRQNRERELGIGQRAPCVELGARDLRVGLGQVQTAVRRKPAQENVAEFGLCGLPAGGEVFHEESLSVRVDSSVRVEEFAR